MYLCVRWGLWNAHANRGNPITCRQDLQLFLHSILCSVVTNIEENFIFFLLAHDLATVRIEFRFSISLTTLASCQYDSNYLKYSWNDRYCAIPFRSTACCGGAELFLVRISLTGDTTTESCTIRFTLTVFYRPVRHSALSRPSSANSINSWMTRKSRRETSSSHTQKRLQVASNDRLKMILVGDWIDWLSRTTCFCYCCRRWDLLPSAEGGKSFSFL